jgi:hypothetical protein
MLCLPVYADFTADELDELCDTVTTALAVRASAAA